MKPKDQIRIGPEVAPGRRIAVRRCGENFAIGTFGGMKDGRPIPKGAELIRMAQEQDTDGWRDATVLYRNEPEPEPEIELAPLEETHGSGPAQVATPAYRESYDRIFGKQKVGLA